MPTLEARLISAADFKSDEPVNLTFELTNTGGEDLYVLTWYTPLEGLFSDCLKVERDGGRVEYDGPLPKRGNPTAENYVLVPAGQTVSKEVEVSRAYDVNTPGNYDVELDTEVDDIVTAAAAKTLDESINEGNRQNSKQELRGGGTSFTVTPGGGGKNLTDGEQARETTQAKRGADAAPPDDETAEKAGPMDPELTGGDANKQAKTRQAHADGYVLCRDALSTMANDANYREWFGTHTAQRFAKVKDNLTKVKQKMESTTFTYILTGEGCQSNWYAYTYKGDTRIWLCGLFWSAPATGTNSKAGTILHEHTHATARTDDIVYLQDKCRQLAIDDPDRAIKNADSHEYYAKG